MNKIQSDVILYLNKNRYTNQRDLSQTLCCSLGKINKELSFLADNGYIDDNANLTSKSKDLIKSSVPKNAIILAAGFGMRMVPINMDIPKALIEIKGEPLIERLIRQLHQAGIYDIDIVVGFKKDLFDESIIKTAFNANFERVCLSKYFNKNLSPKMFRCTQVHALYLGLPHGLDNVAKTLRLKEQKLEEGKNLIRFFMNEKNVDLITSKENSKEKMEVLKKYEEFKKYCINDVVVERSIKKVLEKVKIPKIENKLWQLDQEINDRGVLVDKKLLENACIYDSEFKEALIKKLKNITKVENPKSNNQIKLYLKKLGLEVISLNKESVEKLLKSEEVLNNPKYEEIKEVLNLRSKLNKTSTKKYEAMKRCVCSDGRIRGLFQFYGANRTGRWAGRLVQVQNLPQNKLENLEEVRSIIIKI